MASEHAVAKAWASSAPTVIPDDAAIALVDVCILPEAEMLFSTRSAPQMRGGVEERDKGGDEKQPLPLLRHRMELNVGTTLLLIRVAAAGQTH